MYRYSLWEKDRALAIEQPAEVIMQVVDPPVAQRLIKRAGGPENMPAEYLSYRIVNVGDED